MSSTRTHQAERQRRCRARRALAMAQHGQAAAAGDVTSPVPPVRDGLQVPNEAPVEVRRMGGESAYTDVLTYADGTRVVRKDYSRLTYQGEDPVAAADAEELAPKVLAAVGLPAPAIHRSAPDTVHMEFIDGQTEELSSWGSGLLPEVRDSRDGQLLGLADHLTTNTDRNEGNVIRRNGRLVGIDHGAAFVHSSLVQGTTSRFADSLYTTTNRATPTVAPTNLFSPRDMARVGSRLEALRPEFDRLGRADWHASMMRRHHEIAQGAHGTTDWII